MRKINIIIIFFLLIFYCYFINIISIPDKIIVSNDNNLIIKNMPGITVKKYTETVNSGEDHNYKYEYSLLGLIKIKDVTVNKLEDISLVPLGNLIGLRLYTNGVLVVGTSNIEDVNNEIKLQENILEGDTIIKINEEEIDSIEEIKMLVKESNGKSLTCTILRDGEIILSNINPIKISETEYKLGLWVKEAATGVGTISFYNNKTNEFVALGHGITDPDTGKVLDIESGEVLLADFAGIVKGVSGKPGEIKGSSNNNKIIGKVYKNTIFGIVGRIENISGLNINKEDEFKILSRNEIKEGKASIICEIDDGVQEYEIEIQKVYLNNNFDNKSMVIKITDENLINKTGGIVRGMSGSPIIQDGKIAGIITNVLISDPKIGYGVFMDLVLNEM